MWNARTKDELIIEVWERLDCENVGAAEIMAIEVAVGSEYGEAAVDSPMVIARLLADEGAELRHSEIMELYLERISERPHEVLLRDILNIDGLSQALASIKRMEDLRIRYGSENDKKRLRLLRETAISGKQDAIRRSELPDADSLAILTNREIAQWLTIWLQNPLVFESWVDLRLSAAEFVSAFGDIREK